MARTSSSRTLSEYAELFAHFIGDDALALDRYSTSDAAVVLKMTRESVLYQIKRGYINAEKIYAEKHADGTKHRDVAAYVITHDELERILKAGPSLLQYTVRTWPRLLYKLEHGEKPR